MDPDHHGLAAAVQRLGRDRDPQAWTFIIEHCSPASEHLARRLAGHAELAQDAVQEAWLQIRDCAKNFTPRGADPDAGAWGWIMRVTANTTLVWMRRHRRYRRLAVPMPDLAEPAAPDAQAPNPELSEALRHALAELPEDQRTAVVLHHLSGLDFIAVGAASGCSAATAKMRAHRAIERLRKQLRPAGAALSVLAVTSALTALPAAEGAVSVPFATLLTSGAKAKLATASVFGGMTMSMKMMLLALALSAVGGGLVIAQDKQPPPPPQPAATSTAIEVVPIDIETPDPGWVRELAQLSLAGGEGVSWEFILTRVKFAGRYDQGLGFQPFMSPFAWRTEGVFPNKTWKEIFDSFASHTKTSWRIRGAHIDCMPQALLSHLQQSIDAGSLPTGDRTVWFAWMQRSLGSGMSVVVHPRLVASGWDDPANYRMRPGRTTVEAIIAGLAKSWGVSAYVMTAEQTVLIAARPTHRPMKPPVEIEQSYIVYNPPLPAIVDKEVSVSFEDLGMPQVVEQLTLLAGVPVKLDARAQDAPVVTLKVDRMKLRHVCAYIATISGTDAQYLDDHIFFAYDKVLVPKDATPHRDPDVMTPSKVSF